MLKISKSIDLQVVTTDVGCDDHNCTNQTTGVIGSKIHGEAARAAAKAQGWVQVRQVGRIVDLCPECARRVRVGET